MPMADSTRIRLTGAGLIIAFGTLMGFLLAVLGASPRPGRYLAAITGEQQVLLAVLLAGALGGCMHVGTSFADYVGNKKYESEWQWWYTLRPFIGAALALVFLCMVKAGWLPVGQSTGSDGKQTLNLYAMTALGALVGMFSKQAIDKLDNAFDTLLRTDKDEKRGDGLTGAADAAAIALSPARVEVGSPDRNVVVTGEHLPSKPTATFNGHPRDIRPGSAGSLVLSLKEDDFVTAGDFDVVVSNGDGPGAKAVLHVVAVPAAASQIPVPKVVAEAQGGVEIVSEAPGTDGTASAPGDGSHGAGAEPASNGVSAVTPTTEAADRMVASEGSEPEGHR